MTQELFVGMPSHDRQQYANTPTQATVHSEVTLSRPAFGSATGHGWCAPAPVADDDQPAWESLTAHTLAVLTSAIWLAPDGDDWAEVYGDGDGWRVSDADVWAAPISYGDCWGVPNGDGWAACEAVEG
jgi:hypothetical protein